jgi:hypothetical protein
MMTEVPNVNGMPSITAAAEAMQYERQHKPQQTPLETTATLSTIAANVATVFKALL